MNVKLIRIYSFLVAISMLAHACVNNVLEEEKENDLLINLRWFPGSFEQSKDEVKIGFGWVLSSLGAMLPTGSLNQVMMELDENIYEIDLSKAGFEDKSLRALSTIVAALKRSQAYQSNNYIEMGRFVMLTLNSSNHYYEITQMPENLNDFRSSYAFAGKQLRLNKSSISIAPRLIEIAEATRFEEIAYLAVEGTGAFENNSFTPKEFEVFDFMPNGQLRFAIYDIDERLKEVADESITIAGKPAKCLWCHETGIQPLFQENPVLEGGDFISESDFISLRDAQNLFLAEYRDALSSEIDFFELQDHRFQEYIYIDFMEPTIGRVAMEWDMDIDEVADILVNIPTHTQSEYLIENVYDRFDIDRLAPFTSLNVPESAREFSENEPDFFNFQ